MIKRLGTVCWIVGTLFVVLFVVSWQESGRVYDGYLGMSCLFGALGYVFGGLPWKCQAQAEEESMRDTEI